MNQYQVKILGVGDKITFKRNNELVGSIVNDIIIKNDKMFVATGIYENNGFKEIIVEPENIISYKHNRSGYGNSRNKNSQEI